MLCAETNNSSKTLTLRVAINKFSSQKHFSLDDWILEIIYPLTDNNSRSSHTRTKVPRRRSIICLNEMTTQQSIKHVRNVDRTSRDVLWAPSCVVIHWSCQPVSTWTTISSCVQLWTSGEHTAAPHEINKDFLITEGRRYVMKYSTESTILDSLQRES